MVNIAEIIAKATTDDIHLYLKDGKLAYLAEQGKLSLEFLGLIRKNKEAIVSYLKENVDDFQSKSTVDISKNTNQIVAQKDVFISPNHVFTLSNSTDKDRNAWNVMSFVNCPTHVESDRLQQSLFLIVKRYDSLRLRFSRLKGGGWKSEITDKCDCYGFNVIDCAGLTDEKKEIEIRKAYEVMAEKSNITTGPLIQATLFDYGHDKPSDVLLFVHHYAVDMLAFEFLTQELLHMYEQLLENNSVKLPNVGLSYYDYTKLTRDYCLSEICIEKVDYWTSLIEKDINGLPLDYDNRHVSIWHSRRVFGSLSVENTERLLTISKQYREFQIVDILLASLLITYIQWTKKCHLYVCFQDYGRSMSIEKENLYDLVGWVSTFYPMTLKYQENWTFLETLEYVRNYRKAVPSDNSYGLLKYSHPNSEVREKMAPVPEPLLYFNYTGNSSQNGSNEESQENAESISAPHEGAMRDRYLRIDISISNGQLNVAWDYVSELFDSKTIKNLNITFLNCLENISSHLDMNDLS